ncbi:MAG TPA: NfeD family protein [Pyrinomonadaceae bacterium]|jgi:membrane-bound ClpP family serine protease|nr:NfeD family protein [Pyrinomonadaceae bacterium]
MVYWNVLQEFARGRSKKRRPYFPAVSSTAIVNTDLNPRGSVLANGELWTAQTAHGNPITRQTTVTIVGFQDHLLLVTERA